MPAGEEPTSGQSSNPRADHCSAHRPPERGQRAEHSTRGWRLASSVAGGHRGVLVGNGNGIGIGGASGMAIESWRCPPTSPPSTGLPRPNSARPRPSRTAGRRSRRCWPPSPSTRAPRSCRRTSSGGWRDCVWSRSGGPRGRGGTPSTSSRRGPAQVVLLGPPNAGKSSLLAALTRAEPAIADYPFTTTRPQPGMMPFEDVQIQLVDLPPVTAQHMEPWLPNVVQTADAALLLADPTSPAVPGDVEEVIDRLASVHVPLVGESWGGRPPGHCRCRPCWSSPRSTGRRRPTWRCSRSSTPAASRPCASRPRPAPGARH